MDCEKVKKIKMMEREREKTFIRVLLVSNRKDTLKNYLSKHFVGLTLNHIVKNVFFFYFPTITDIISCMISFVK